MHRPPLPSSILKEKIIIFIKVFNTVYDILGFTILLKYFHRLSFKILEWGCEKFGNEIEFGKTVNKEELYDLLRWFHTEVQPKEELVEILMYRNLSFSVLLETKKSVNISV